MQARVERDDGTRDVRRPSDDKPNSVSVRVTIDISTRSRNILKTDTPMTVVSSAADKA